MLSNLPPSASPTSLINTDEYYAKPFEIDAGTFNMMKGFFQSKGFDITAAETISVTLMKQAKNDGYNPLEVLSTIKTFDGVQLNTVISEILNYSRYKTSYLGTSANFTPFEPVSRNIQA